MTSLKHEGLSGAGFKVEESVITKWTKGHESAQMLRNSCYEQARERIEGGEEVKMALKGVFQFNKNHSLVPMLWLEHKDFLKFLTEMDLGMQVSLSESFNIVAADYCYSGLPMVVSSEIRWASKNVVADAGDVDNIVEKLFTCHKYTEESREGLDLMNIDAVRRWNDFVEV